MAAIYVELSFLRLYEGQPIADEVQAQLERNGFRHVATHNLVHGDDGQPLQADFLFERA